jgi:predicted AAA+ superfamily ATPase
MNLWHKEYHQRLFKEDLRDLSRIQDLLRMEHLFDFIKSRVGLTLSFNSLREDLAVSHATIVSSINILSRLYTLFLIRPYHHKIQYSLKKEPKCYLYDWTLCPNEGSRFENFLAILLQNYCYYLTDGGWANVELMYLRDKQKREADFVIVQNEKPLFIVEAKLSKTSDTNQYEHFSKSLNNIPCFIVTQEPEVFTKPCPNLWQISVSRFVNLIFK